jgi:chromosome segregation ATPase
MLKQVMMMKPDKLRGECENSQVTEELAVCTKEVEQLKEQLKSCDKEWQERLRAETDRWQARLEEHQQDVETEQAKMADAVAGKICLCFWEREKNKSSLESNVLLYQSLRLQYVLKNCVRKEQN